MAGLLRIWVLKRSMFYKLFISAAMLLTAAGCVYNDEPMPRIVYDYPAQPAPPTVLQAPTAPSPAPAASDFSRQWYPPRHLEKNWTAIVIHHSGTDQGNAAIFDKWHREGNHWEGVGYDFVIGNGTDSADGQVEVTFRWKNQITGAHCGGTPGNWANQDGIGICLVGDFSQTAPTTRQMQSLANLVTFLQQRYRIPKSRVYGHGATPGARVTECPGRLFPMARLKSMLSY